jgi:hypothetical protein
MSLRAVTQAGRSTDLGGGGPRPLRAANGGTLGDFFDVFASAGCRA